MNHSIEVSLVVGKPDKEMRLIIERIWTHDDVLIPPTSELSALIDFVDANARQWMERLCDVTRGLHYWQWFAKCLDRKLLVSSLPEQW